MSGEPLIRTATNTMAAAATQWNGRPAELFAHLADALHSKQLLQPEGAAGQLEGLRALMNAQPAELTEAQMDALVNAGDRAVNDYYHERACSCDLWPSSCHTDPAYAKGYWDSSAFGIGLPAVIGLWEVMRAAGDAGELGRLRARVAELEADLTIAHRATETDKAAPPFCRHVSPHGCTCDLDAGHNGDHEMSDGAGGHFGWPVEEPKHSAPCRWPASPDCTCTDDVHARVMAPDKAGACDVCGDSPSKWCPDCAACRSGCHGGHVDNPCAHANARWGGVA
ncbi:hypothetical protein [Streptomyces flavidovirens]|uniref:hypothetical protein n=1 Tax=Streptomyces flavidovirens TaxID=67298 RepID=UPI0004131AC7|nr:hypothetical protein [Streptomyces flavidovirens]